MHGGEPSLGAIADERKHEGQFDEAVVELGATVIRCDQLKLGSFSEARGPTAAA